MANFFKTFLKGLLYLVTLPALIIALAVYLVISIFMFIYLGIKGIVLFFKGENLFGDLPEDIEARKRLTPAGATANEAPIFEAPRQENIYQEPQQDKPIFESPRQESQNDFNENNFFEDLNSTPNVEEEEIYNPTPEEEIIEEKTIEPKTEEEIIPEPAPLPKEEEYVSSNKMDDIEIMHIHHDNDDEYILDDDEEESSGVNISFDEEDKL